MLVVLVNGLPGAGKTTLAKPLAGELSLPVLSKDRIKGTLARRRYEEREAGRHPVHHGALFGDQQWEELGRQAQSLGLRHTYCVDTTKPVDVSALAREICRHGR